MHIISFIFSSFLKNYSYRCITYCGFISFGHPNLTAFLKVFNFSFDGSGTALKLTKIRNPCTRFTLQNESQCDSPQFSPSKPLQNINLPGPTLVGPERPDKKSPWISAARPDCCAGETVGLERCRGAPAPGPAGRAWCSPAPPSPRTTSHRTGLCSVWGRSSGENDPEFLHELARYLPYIILLLGDRKTVFQILIYFFTQTRIDFFSFLSLNIFKMSKMLLNVEYLGTFENSRPTLFSSPYNRLVPVYIHFLLKRRLIFSVFYP